MISENIQMKIGGNSMILYVFIYIKFSFKYFSNSAFALKISLKFSIWFGYCEH